MSSRIAATVFAAFLSVTPTALAAPANDNFANARGLRLGQTVRGSITDATRQSGEPRHAHSAATHSVWYRLRAKRTMTVAINTCTTSFDTVVAVYAGRSLRGLELVQYNDNGCSGRGGRGSRVTFRARSGVTYRIVVVGFVDKGRFRIGAFELTVPPNDYFADAVTVTLGQTFEGTTLNATRELGEPPHRYNRAHTVWFNLSVTTATLVEAMACSAEGVAVYTGKSVTSLTRVAPTATVGCFGEQFQAEAGVTYRISVESGGRGIAFRFATREVTP